MRTTSPTTPELGRNDVIIDIGDGNSGNTTEAHLHFHVMRAPVPLSSDNVPFEIDRFTFVGTFNDDRFVPEAKPSERTNQLPLAWDVINFPAAD